jgi:erythronate-4-phosphate dehydrogenase
MILAVDQAIPYWEDAFSEFGEVRPFPGRDLRREDIRDVDILVVRTVTPVNASVLEGSSVRFVAAASAGIDHIDLNCLKRRGIRFGSAAGCNANAVSEYVLTALHVIALRRNWNLSAKSLAVIGVGNVGSRVADKARALGMEVLLCDPPLRDSTGDLQYRDLEDVLEADILSFHVPLVYEGPYPTWHMVDRKMLDRLSPRQFLINTARGAVFDNRELRSALREGKLEGVILDVWEEEPRIDYFLLELADIGTPHIAGLTLDGKIRATEIARGQLCSFLGVQSAWNTDALYPARRVIAPEQKTTGQNAVLSILLQAFDILKDDRDLREIGSAAAKRAADSFDRMRNHYLLRPEFNHFAVDLGGQHGDLAVPFAALGFALRS